jgi:hypothetical protein
MRESALRFTWPLMFVLFMFGCRTSAPSVLRYTVTATPVHVVGGLGLCIAVDRTDPQGIWWWEPGPSGCASRTTGPTVFRADRAEVKTSADSSSIHASFTLQLHSGSRDVKFALQDSEMRITDSDLRVSTQRRADLEIPFAYAQKER